MHIAKETVRELVVVDGKRWMAVLYAAGASVLFYFVIARHELRYIFIASIFLLLAVPLDVRKTFVFDAMQRKVRWRGRKILKFESGEIPFDEITDIGRETGADSYGPGGPGPYQCRLTVVTPHSTIPMAYAYGESNDMYADLRLKILQFIKSGSTA